MKNIILIGFMGCGKSSVGSKLARALHMQFQDTDQLLEESFGCKISEFFEKEGEAEFRNRETALLKQLNEELQNTVLATGGGLPLREENAELLKKLGTVIYLKASKETTLKRLHGDTTRPLLAGGDVEEKVERLLEQRIPLYTAAADLIITTDEKSFYEIINEIEKQCRN
ncbi:MAG: shikimate kinase [Lachnospiraceae bacterium]|nr:shikimate kinase [Lachnospiraceae bacterium]